MSESGLESAAVAKNPDLWSKGWEFERTRSRFDKVFGPTGETTEKWVRLGTLVVVSKLKWEGKPT